MITDEKNDFLIRLERFLESEIKPYIEKNYELSIITDCILEIGDIKEVIRDKIVKKDTIKSYIKSIYNKLKEEGLE